MNDRRTRAAERLGLLTRLGFARRTINRSSTLYCPHCRAGSHERMPLDRTLHEFHCLWCNRTVQHGPEEHCIYCAFGSRPCPEKQRRTLITAAPDFTSISSLRNMRFTACGPGTAVRPVLSGRL